MIDPAEFEQMSPDLFLTSNMNGDKCAFDKSFDEPTNPIEGENNLPENTFDDYFINTNINKMEN